MVKFEVPGTGLVLYNDAAIEMARGYMLLKMHEHTTRDMGKEYREAMKRFYEERKSESQYDPLRFELPKYEPPRYEPPSYTLPKYEPPRCCDSLLNNDDPLTPSWRKYW